MKIGEKGKDGKRKRIRGMKTRERITEIDTQRSRSLCIH